MEAKDIFNKIGEEMGIKDFFNKVLQAGEKKTALLDASGIASKQAVMKTEDGNEYPASCYAYVPDEEKTSTWKLRMCAVGTTEITREQLGAAAAAFSPGGFRGQKVQLPSEDEVKAKIRSEYKKLGVEEDEIPESVKMMEDEKMEDEKFNALKVKFLEKSMHSDMRAELEKVLGAMDEKEADTTKLVRQLAEMVAQIQDAELREALNELVNEMLAMFAVEEEMEPVEEEPTEEMLDEEKSQEPVAEKSQEEQVLELAKALKLDELSEYMQKQTTSQETFNSQIAEAMQELVNKVKSLSEEVAGLKNVEPEVKEVVEEEKHFKPFWGSALQASKAVSTELDNKQAEQFTGPQVPGVIQKMSNRMLNK